MSTRKVLWKVSWKKMYALTESVVIVTGVTAVPLARTWMVLMSIIEDSGMVTL